MAHFQLLLESYRSPSYRSAVTILLPPSEKVSDPRESYLVEVHESICN